MPIKSTLSLDVIKRVVTIIFGATIAAVGLEAFLVPNNIIDGGVVGLSIMSSHAFGIPIGVFLIILNIPFIYLGWRRLGKLFALSSLFGVAILSIATNVLHHSFLATADPILAAVFGGTIVGVGVGTVIRAGGTLDGTEIVAVLADRKLPFSVGEIIMFINFFILSSAGFVFGWDRAMYSLIAYFVAFKVIDITVEGLDESKSVWIISNKYLEIGGTIEAELDRNVVYVNGKSTPEIVADGVMFTVISRIEEQKLKAIIQTYDKNAFVVINNVHEVMSRQHHKSTH